MSDLFPQFQNLRNRSIIPRARPPSAPAGLRQARFAKVEEHLPDPANVQGDIYLLFPKIAERFLFFWIEDSNSFKVALRQYQPTSSADVVNDLRSINSAKENGEIANVVQTQIAFSRSGLNKLGWLEAVGDIRFDGGSMRRDKETLGDGRQWDPIFDSGTVDGMFIIAAPDSTQRFEAARDIKGQFGSGVGRFRQIDADRRTGANSKHEHFGYRDGVSQPAIRGLTDPHPGQLQCDPGVIIMGYKGDSVFDNTDPRVPKRPTWTKDGTFMVFRKLEQDVKGFRNYCETNGPRWKNFWPPGTVGNDLTDDEATELWGARMIGRWKSGCPLDMSPYRDDPNIAGDADRVNDFDYTAQYEQFPSQIRCPFVAHTRKTAPRNLDPFVDKTFLESALIVRAGMPYGRDYDDAPEDANRGLAFVCYSSSIMNGFFRQTVDFANNNYFPHTTFVPERHGQDPILGGPGDIFDTTLVSEIDNDLIPDKEVTLRVTNRARELLRVSGFVKKEDLDFKEDFFVTSRGGEYFFVPSIQAVKHLASDSVSAPPKAL